MTLASQFSQLGASIDAALASLPVPGPPPPSQGGGRSYVLDPRDFGGRGDGIHDDTEAITAAMQAALVPSNPREVRIVSGRWKTGPLHIPGPGVYLRGEGFAGQSAMDGPCTRLIARDEPGDIGPMFSFDPAKVPGGQYQWLRNVGLRRLCFDVWGCRRFNEPREDGLPMPPVVELLGISNIRDVRDLCVRGNIGTAYHIAINTVAAAITENITFDNLYSYAGFLELGGFTEHPPVDDCLVISGSDAVVLRGGLLAYGYAGGMIPVTDRASAKAAVRIEPGQLGGPWPPTSANLCNNGVTLDGVRIANYPVSVRVAVRNFGGQWFAPSLVRLQNLLVENFNSGIVVNQEAPAGLDTYWRSAIFVSQCLFAGSNAWFGPNPVQFVGNLLRGGQIDLAWMLSSADAVLGPYTRGVRVNVGPHPDPNQRYRGTDKGVGNKWDYAD